MPARILIVDDQLFLRRTLAQLIQEEGWQVVGEASNGKEAIEMYAALEPDLVIMDYQMPLVSGMDALKVIRGFRPEAKVIMLTSLIEQEHIDAARKLGALDYIVKPYKKDHLIAAIRNALTQIRILVVDDQPVIRHILKGLVRENGWLLVGEAVNGVEAIDLFSATNPDLVIMDNFLPLMNGIEALKVIKRMDSTARVVMLTSDLSPESRDAAIQAGAEDYLAKPFEKDFLASAIKKAISELYEARIAAALAD